jgi:hypothetical protein
LRITNGSAWSYSFSSGKTLSTQNWNHIAVTYNTSTILYYLNGELVSERNYDGVLIPNTNPLTIARYVSATQYFNGSLDEVKVYNRTLSPSEVRNSYLGQTVSSQGLCGYWSFNETTGTVAIDSSGIISITLG